MLSDAIRTAREGLAALAASDAPMDAEAIRMHAGVLRLFEIEARNMEERLAAIAGRPHAPLGLNAHSTAPPPSVDRVLVRAAP